MHSSGNVQYGLVKVMGIISDNGRQHLVPIVSFL